MASGFAWARNRRAVGDPLGVVAIVGGLVLGQQMQVEVVLGDVNADDVLHRIPLPCICELIRYNGSGDCSGS
jgi:hypothetical protein